MSERERDIEPLYGALHAHGGEQRGATRVRSRRTRAWLVALAAVATIAAALVLWGAR